MAIKKQHEKFGVQFPKAYHRIEGMIWNGSTGTTEVAVQTYQDGDNTVDAMTRRVYILDIQKANISLSKCYVELSNHVDFVGGTEI